MPDVESPVVDMVSLTERHCANSYVYGHGLATTQSIACIFCGAKDFMKLGVISAQEDAQKTWTCSECKRSARNIITPLAGGGGYRFRWVQTGGPAQPEWMNPKVLQEGDELPV